MKVIFLDVDGVLNCADTRRAGHHHTWPDWPFLGMDRRLIKKLSTIVEETGAEIVVSSTWRKNFTPEEMREKLVTGGLTKDAKVIDSTPSFGGPRRNEIRDWLNRHPDVTTYVVIDDDSDASIDGHFVHTAHWNGLTDEDVESAIKLLN